MDIMSLTLFMLSHVSAMLGVIHVLQEKFWLNFIQYFIHLYYANIFPKKISQI